MIWLAIDRVDRIEPRVQEQPERRRRATRPFPELDRDKEKREPDASPASPRTPRAVDDGEEDDTEPRLIDLRVLGWLPTRQILPGGASAVLPN